MPRIFIPKPLIKGNLLSIIDEKAKYLTNVLRCQKRDELVVFDGEGNCLRTEILKADRREVVAEVLEKFPCNTESPVDIVLVQGLLKGQKMDLVIQKTTELGVKEIIPVITERCQPRETRKVSRWQKIAGEASRQSGRSIVPVIHEPMKFNDFFSLLVTHYSSQPIRGFIFYEEGGVKIIEAISSPITRHFSLFVVIGPEGGFTTEEISKAKDTGFIVITLGKRILRAETAAISAVTLMQFLFGDLN